MTTKLSLPEDLVLGSEFDTATEAETRRKAALVAVSYGKTPEERAMFIDMLGVRD
jgi:hypothetical protein